MFMELAVSPVPAASFFVVIDIPFIEECVAPFVPDFWVAAAAADIGASAIVNGTSAMAITEATNRTGTLRRVRRVARDRVVLGRSGAVRTSTELPPLSAACSS
jgi:hypothetical protein